MRRPSRVCLFLFIGMLSLPCVKAAAQQPEPPRRLPYYTPGEILVFKKATKQHQKAMVYMRSGDYEEWAKSVQDLYDLAGKGRLAQGREMQLLDAYMRVAVDDLVRYVEKKRSHRGATMVLQILQDRLASSVFPDQHYEERLRSIINEYDQLCAELKSERRYQSAAERRRGLIRFLERARALDVDTDLIRKALEPELGKLVQRVQETGNVLEARELLREDSPLYDHLGYRQKRELRDVVTPD